MNIFSKIKRAINKNVFQIRKNDVNNLKRDFLKLHDLYERDLHDLSLAQKCSYYALNISTKSKASEIIFFCHEIAVMYSSDFRNYNKAIKYLKLGLDYVQLTKYEEQNEDLVYFNSLLGKSYYFKEEYRKSLNYYLEAKELVQKTGAGKEDMDTILNSIESIKEKIGD